MKTPIQIVIDNLKHRISELNNADAYFCKDRWNTDLTKMQRDIAREESNKVTFARQVLELQLISIIEILKLEKQTIVDAYEQGKLDEESRFISSLIMDGETYYNNLLTK